MYTRPCGIWKWNFENFFFLDVEYIFHNLETKDHAEMGGIYYSISWNTDMLALDISFGNLLPGDDHSSSIP